jgi:hypothetical protein
MAMIRRTREEPGIMAEFATELALQRAVVRIRELGYERVEVYSPYPVLGATALLDLKRPPLNWWVFWFAMTGAGLAFLVQWFVNAENFPINVGGRPLFSLPAWVPVIFEMGVLAAGFTALFGLLITCGLPRLWHPAFEVEGFDRVTTDRFWVAIDWRDPLFDPVESRLQLEELDTVRVTVVEARI